MSNVVYPELNENALKVLEKRNYLWPKADGTRETVDEMFGRVARVVASAENKFSVIKPKYTADEFEAEIYHLMRQLKFIPNTPTLINAGRPKGQLAACYVLGTSDSMEGIMDTLKAQALVQKSGGGCIKEGSKIFLSTLGMVDIDQAYDKYRHLGEQYHAGNDAHYIDIAGERAKSLSLNDNGEFKWTNVTKLWRYNVRHEDSLEIETNKGSTFVTSHYHPFMVNDGGKVVERRADELKVGDTLYEVDASAVAAWPFAGVRPDPDRAWLLGLFAGDGNISVNKHNANTKYRIRTRIFNKNRALLEQAARIIAERVTVSSKYTARANESVRPRVFKEKRYDMFIMENSSKALGEYILNAMEMQPGSKLLSADIPQNILNSDVDNIYAFIAGLIDSDGHVEAGRSRLSITTASKAMANSLAGVLNLLSIKTRVRVREPAKQHWHETFEVAIVGYADCTKTLNTIGKYIRQEHKLTALKQCTKRVCQPISDLTVKSIKMPDTAYKFYDLSCDPHNNYVAGELGLSVIHNTGFSFSCIREKGSLIKSTGMRAVGPIPVIKLMNYLMTNFIIQGGVRHGANMGVLPCDHFDIEEFITFKDKDGSCASFNVSVGATDDFMNAVVSDGDLILKSRAGEPDKAIKARPLFDLIAEQAWRTGDPGLLFMDTIERFNPTPHLGKLEATNPCFSGDTLIATDMGLLPIIDIVRGKKATKALGLTGEYEDIVARYDNGVKKLIKVTTRYGYSLTVTEDHKWRTVDGKKQTKELAVGDRVYLQASVPDSALTVINKSEYDKGEFIGWLIGDGYLNKRGSKKMGGIIIGKTDNAYISHIQDLFEANIGNRVKEHVRPQYSTTQLLSSKLWTWAVDDCGIEPHKSGSKEVPKCIMEGSVSMQRGFLRGLFSSDGQVFNRTIQTGKKKKTVNKRGMRLTSKSHKLLADVQLLLAQFGISANMLNRSRPARSKVFSHTKTDGSTVWYGSDGVCWELDLQSPGWSRFKDVIGFVQKYKNDTLDSIVIASGGYANPNSFDGTIEITSIDDAGEGETFNLTVSPNHHVCANGISIPQCGEQSLLPNEACTLGHFNLSLYVTADGRFDYDAFAADIHIGVRFLDNVIEINHYALPEIERMHRQLNRKIGLGVMGLADALIKMRIPYASAEGRKVAGKIAKTLRVNADAASMALGRERGNFGSFIGSEVAKHFSHMRNACRTTVAPTGTTGMIAGVSTGIEPVYALGLRREQAGMVMFEWHSLFEEWMASKSEADQASINAYYDQHGTLRGCKYVSADEEHIFMQANDIRHSDHIEMQAAWQMYIDNAISKTINLPNDATVQDVKDAYMLAWRSGCKGITVYRDGCRSHQALSAASSKQLTIPLNLNTPLPGGSYSIGTNTAGITWTATDGLGIPMTGYTSNTAVDVPYTIVGYNSQIMDAVEAECPECKAPEMEINGGCSLCKGCGYSACSI